MCHICNIIKLHDVHVHYCVLNNIMFTCDGKTIMVKFSMNIVADQI